MKGLLEQLKDLFVFTCCESGELKFAMPKIWGRENNTPETQSMTNNVPMGITSGENVLFARLRKQFDANWSITQMARCNSLYRNRRSET